MAIFGEIDAHSFMSSFCISSQYLIVNLSFFPIVSVPDLTLLTFTFSFDNKIIGLAMVVAAQNNPLFIYIFTDISIKDLLLDR